MLGSVQFLVSCVSPCLCVCLSVWLYHCLSVSLSPSLSHTHSLTHTHTHTHTQGFNILFVLGSLCRLNQRTANWQPLLTGVCTLFYTMYRHLWTRKPWASLSYLLVDPDLEKNLEFMASVFIGSTGSRAKVDASTLCVKSLIQWDDLKCLSFLVTLG